MYRKNRTLAIFISSVLLPILIIAYLVINTFIQRRDITHRLLDSNLWRTAETALVELENRLLDLERGIFSNYEERLPYLVASSGEVSSIHPAGESYPPAQPFVLGPDFELIYPQSSLATTQFLEPFIETGNDSFFRIYEEATLAEFQRRDYDSAAFLFEQSQSAATSLIHKALALEGAGRCLTALQKDDRAVTSWRELASNYGHLRNRAGHPFGISANLQLSEISWRQDDHQGSILNLMEVYEKLKAGTYILSLPAYTFFINEIENRLEKKLADGSYPEIENRFEKMQLGPSLFMDKISFSEFIRTSVIPNLREKSEPENPRLQAQEDRIWSRAGEHSRLISYKWLSDEAEPLSYLGIAWQTIALIEEILPEMLASINTGSDILIHINDHEGKDLFTGKVGAQPIGSPSLSFRQFPLPWKISVSMPSQVRFEKISRREIFFIGALLIAVVLLMGIGITLIVRDFSREAASSRMKTNFIHTVSHELKTPLTLIRLHAQTIFRKKGMGQKDKEACSRIIVRESERLTHMVDNLLDMSRIDMGKKEIVISRESPAELTASVLADYQNHLEDKGFVVTLKAAENLPEFKVDKEAFASVLINLLSNAMKFSGDSREIFVSLSQTYDAIVLDVEDRGVGILPGEIDRIFEKFFRSRDSAAVRTKGSGLGLTIVKHLAEIHGGSVRVRSQVGQGSIFSVLFPIGDSTKAGIDGK